MTLEVSADLDLSPVRVEFPSLALEAAGRTAVYFDNPGGTQVHQDVIEAISNYYRTANSNTGGAFLTSRRSDEIVTGARKAIADLLNAESPAQIIFGQNMTTLTFGLARAFGRTIKPGDEIIVTELDHDANVAPWLNFADLGAIIKTIPVNKADCTLDMEALKLALSNKTRLVAVTAASNAVGTFPDIAEVIRLAHSVGARVYVDAVQYAPHGPLDVQALDCDFLACSAYKFFGPHQGILYGKLELLEELQPFKVRPAKNASPYKWETGTQSHESMAGTAAAVEYLASVGRRFGEAWRAGYEQAGFSGQRLDLKMGLAAILAYEQRLGERLLKGLAEFDDLQIYGITDPAKFEQRGPTVAFTWARRTPRETAELLGQRGIFLWDGNYYALSLMETLGLEGRGGAVRIGPSHYNTFEEIDYFLEVLRGIR